MSGRLPQITSIDLVHALERLGFVIRHQTGSHRILRHPMTKRIASMPIHARDLKRGLLFGILKQAGVSSDELRSVL